MDSGKNIDIVRKKNRDSGIKYRYSEKKNR